MLVILILSQLKGTKMPPDAKTYCVYLHLDGTHFLLSGHMKSKVLQKGNLLDFNDNRAVLVCYYLEL